MGYLHLSNSQTRLTLSKETILARIHNMRKTLINYQYKQLNTLDCKLGKIPHAQDLEELRGQEGMATRYYYLQIIQLLSKTPFTFTERNRRPPRDPFNVLLSYGYNILYQYLNSFILSLGINPDRGYMHRSQSRHIALCSDLIEPFRHLIERAAITIIRRKQIQPRHFYYQGRSCILNNEGRRIYTIHLTRLLETNAGHADIAKPRHIENIYAQTINLKKHIQNPDIIPFTAWRE